MLGAKNRVKISQVVVGKHGANINGNALHLKPCS